MGRVVRGNKRVSTGLIRSLKIVLGLQQVSPEGLSPLKPCKGMKPRAMPIARGFNPRPPLPHH